MNNANHIHWRPRPLNRKGNLSAWKKRMRVKCPNPVLGQVVWLNKKSTDLSTGKITFSDIGYKVIGFDCFGEAMWQRGQEINHHVECNYG